METGFPKLDDDFHVVSKDGERAWRVLRDGLADFLTTDPRAADRELRPHDGQLLTWRTGRTLNTETFESPSEMTLGGPDQMTDGVARFRPPLIEYRPGIGFVQLCDTGENALAGPHSTQAEQASSRSDRSRSSRANSCPFAVARS